MAFGMDGFDYYSSLAANPLWTPTSAACTASGAGAFAYGRASRMDAFTGNMSTYWDRLVAGAGVTANWPTVYAGMHFKIGSYTNCRILFYDGASNQSSISWDATGKTVYSRGDRATTLGTAATTKLTGGFDWITFKQVSSNTVGTFKMYINGVLDLDLTGLDNCATANEYTTAVLFVAGSGALDIDNTHIYNGQDPAPWNDFLVERRIKFELANGDGAVQNWTASAGNAYQCIDENPPNGDTDYISAATVGDKSTFTFPDFTGMVTIDAVNINLNARKDDAGVRAIKAAIRNSGGTLAYGANKTMAGTFAQFQSTFLTDPIAAAAWSLANLNGYEYGVEVAT